MRLILSNQQRVLFLLAAVLVLFVVWIRLLARMNAAGTKRREPGLRLPMRGQNQLQMSVFPRWKRYLAAIMLGNAVYYLLYPHLPGAAQHRQLVDLGTLVDLWICVVFYGLIELGGAWVRNRRK